MLWNTQNHRPTFLPRLGGPITGISRHPADPASLLLRQSDNTLRVVSLASMKVETSVLGLKPRPTGTSPEEGACATALQPATGLLAVPAPNATLQLFDTAHQRHVSQLKVAPRNQVSTPLPLQAPGQAASAMEVDGGEAAAALAAAAAGGQGYDAHSQPRVTRAAFSHDGRCLVTVDVRPDAGGWEMGGARVGSGMPALDASFPPDQLALLLFPSKIPLKTPSANSPLPLPPPPLPP